MTSTRRAVSLVTLCIANLRLRSFPNVKDSIVGDCESQAGSVQSKQPPPSHVAQLGYPASVRCIGSGRGKPGGSSSSHSPAMAAWCVSAKSRASWRVTHGLNQPHEHFAQVPRVMWLTKMRLCSFIGVSRSGGGFGRPVEVVAERVGGLAGRVAHLGAVAAGALDDPRLGKLVGGGEVVGVGDHGRFLSCCLVRTTLLVSRHPVKCPVLNGS